MTITASQSPYAIKTYDIMVTFSSGCSNVKPMNAPPSLIRYYTVNNSPLSHSVTGFTSSIAGCESQLIYSCLECSAFSSIVVF